VRDQKNAGPVVDVAVIVDVDQQVSGETLSLNPAMKNRDELFQLNGCGVSGIKLDPYSMKFHYGFPAAFPV
jgi:hypothetical protein